jgi:hypothetical protein
MSVLKNQMLLRIFKNWHGVFPEDVPIQVGEAGVMFILIKNVHLIGVINGIR